MYSPRMSFEGREFLAVLEGGHQLVVYLDSAKLPTVGVGHLVLKEDKLKVGDRITLQRSRLFLANDLRIAENAINRYIDDVDTLEEWHWDALVSFTFNVGEGALARSTLRRKLNSGDFEEVPEQMARWNKVQGRKSKGLTERRKAEGHLWTTGEYDMDPYSEQGVSDYPRPWAV